MAAAEGDKTMTGNIGFGPTQTPGLTGPSAADDGERRLLTLRDVRRLAASCVGAGFNGRADPAQARELQSLAATAKFTPRARVEFEALLARLGVASSLPIGLPLDDQPYWFRGGHPLAGFRSQPALPSSVDVLIVGLGLTGASAAYHLAEAMQARIRRVAVVDRGDPAGEASGRNAGAFETIPENSVGLYEGMAHERLQFLRRCYPKLPAEVLRAEAERQASVVLGLALHNRRRFRDIIVGEGIVCDFAPRGWLLLAHAERQEQGLCEETVLAARHGETVELWSRAKIRAEFGIASGYLGRFIPGDGTYHPFKYVCGLLRCALARGVEIYTRVPVLRLESQGVDRHLAHTPEGGIAARRVILATNAFTRELVPELQAIEPRQSQIMLTEHVPDRMRGRFATIDWGPAYFNQPRSGVCGDRAPLLMGGGDDRKVRDPASRRRSGPIHDRLLQLRDAFFPELCGQPPSAEWVGPMAFTPDQLPAIGWARPGVVVAVACNGYGGSYTTAAGEAAAQLALTDRLPEWAPEDVFSPLRLIERAPLFLSSHDELWAIATSLSRRLRALTNETADIYSQATVETVSPLPPTAHGHGATAVSAATAEWATLAEVAAFRRFTRDDLAALLAIARAWQLPAGGVLFEEGSVAGSCYIVVRGRVDVSLVVGHRRHLLSSIGPGTLFGEMSLLEGLPRSATCSARTASQVLEFPRDRVEALLSARSPLALGFLGLLTDKLVATLRRADRRRLRLSGARGHPEAEPPVL
jgi:glycine/D-amino acid oxidase-like deaminating enzyme